VGQRAKPADVGVTVGQVLLGKYRVDAILGSGAMGVVAACMHLGLNERRAIKMLRRDVLDDVDAVSRFVREAQAAVKLKSEYVAKVHDVGQFENGVPYLEMECLEGYDLGQLLEQRGPLPAPWACELLVQACEALAEAHSLGIVHRDLKPSNLFVTWRPDGSALVKVLDFGISKSPHGIDMQLTQTQSLLGTPAYMSPEQMRSARLVDARTDIWSLGTVLYELLERRRPFEADSFSEMCVKVAVDPPEPMQHAPAGIQPIILRCLEKDPERRFATTAELARDLAGFAQDQHQATVLVERMHRTLRRSQSDLARESSGVSRPVPGAGLAAAPVAATTVRVSSSRRWPFALVALMLAGAIVAAVAISGWSDGEPQRSVEQSTPPTELGLPMAASPNHEPTSAQAPAPPHPQQLDAPTGSASGSAHATAASDIKAAIDASTAKRPSRDRGTRKGRPAKPVAGSSGSGSAPDCDPFDAMHKC
jgi:serine/threonine-protein kinase